MVLQMCTEYADDAGSSLFGKLFYVIRDWAHDDEVGERKQYFEEVKVN